MIFSIDLRLMPILGVRFSRFLVLFIGFLLNSGLLLAQADKDLVEIADETYRFGDKNDALEQYLLAIKINSENLRANLMAGKVYLETIHKERSLKYLLKAYSLDENVAPDILYLIAQSYHHGEDMDNATLYYAQYQSKVKNERIPEKEKLLREIAQRIRQCEVAKTMIRNPVNVDIESMGDNINTYYPEYAPAINSDETLLIFTSKRSGGTSNDKDVTNEYFEDIYYSTFEDGAWQPAKNIGHPINTPYHDASLALSPDGKRLFLYKDTRNGDIYFSDRLDDGTWTNPERMEGQINSSSAEIAITMSGDSKMMVFASNRQGGQGGFDLYEVRADKKGNWGKPKNIGKTINTPFDEESPYLSLDGKTLYFSSNGHEGMGGLDIFKSQWDEKKKQWAKPENLGYPVNSTDNDIDFVISGSGKMAYFASVKEYGEGEKDIFRIDFEPKAKEPEKEAEKEEKEPEPAMERKVLKPVRLYITVKDQESGEVLSSKVQVADRKRSGQLSMLKEKDGRYSIALQPSASGPYQVTAEKDGYIFRTMEVVLPEAGEEEQTMERELLLKKIKTGTTTVLRNIYFDFDKSTLRPESNNELKKLENLLKENTSVRIQISGHTDKVGSAEYNKQLSDRRAKAVVKHLTDRGIDPVRLTAVGYGEERPLATNDDEVEGREINRRTEFTILNQ